MSQTAPVPIEAPRRRRVSPALALAILSPIIAEILGGATHLSVIFALIPEILVWGLGAVLIREITRRRGLGGASLLLMGFALSLAEEFLIQQTSLAPLPWLKTMQIYGRAWGVSWIYLLFMLGYESVWVVVVPVQLVELLYPERRNEPWLRTRGLVVSCVLFLLGARIAWYGWIKRVRPMVFHLPPYHPSPYLLLAGLLAMIVLVAIALFLPSPGTTAVRRIPPPAAIFLIVMVLGFVWYALLAVQFSTRAAVRAVPFAVPIAAGIAWGAMAFLLLRHWWCAAAWSDRHRYAAVFAAMAACMAGGWLGASAWLRLDTIAQAVFDLAAVFLMIAFGRSLKRAGADS
jgi:hypothetical protein